MKKYFLILFIFFSSMLKADQIVRWETDYYPDFGRVMITYLGEGKVLLEEDRNSCMFDNFGNISACTLMAPIVSIDNINLILQSEVYDLYEFLNAKHLRLAKGLGVSKILKMDESGGVIFAFRLFPKVIETPQYFDILK